MGERHDLLAERRVAGDEARLEERLPLPVLGLRLVRRGVVAGGFAGEAVVARERLARDDEEPVVARRPEARVEVVARPFAVRGGEEPKDALRPPDGALEGVIARGIVVAVDEEEVEVGAVADLFAAELPIAMTASATAPPLFSCAAKPKAASRMASARARSA